MVSSLYLNASNWIWMGIGPGYFICVPSLTTEFFFGDFCGQLLRLPAQGLPIRLDGATTVSSQWQVLVQYPPYLRWELAHAD